MRCRLTKKQRRQRHFSLATHSPIDDLTTLFSMQLAMTEKMHIYFAPLRCTSEGEPRLFNSAHSGYYGTLDTGVYCALLQRQLIKLLVFQ